VKQCGDWAKELFVKFGEVYLEAFEQKWAEGRVVARSIARFLRSQGIKKGKILDIPCGNGRLAIPLAKLGYQVTGVDISPIFIQDGLKRAKKAYVDVRFIQGDMYKFTPKEKYDCAINWFTSIGYRTKKGDLNLFKKLSKVAKWFIIGSLGTYERYCKYPEQNTYFGETKNYITLERIKFSPEKSTLNARWIWYKKVGRDLIYVGEHDVNLRLYSVPELCEMLRKSGWEIYGLHSDIQFKQEWKPGEILYVITKNANPRNV